MGFIESLLRQKSEPKPRLSKVELHIDHWPRSDWLVEQEELVGGSWVTVALGPVADAVDADGVFKTTFRIPHLGGPTQVEKLQEKAKRHWLPEQRGFEHLSVESLAPEKVRESFQT